MEVRVQEDGPARRTLELSLSPEEVDRHLDRAAGEFQRRAALPGFRRGRVPRSVLEARFGGSIQEEAVESAVNEAYGRAIREQGLTPLTPPVVEDLQYRRGEALRFKVTVEVRPEVQAADYKEIPLTRRVREITDEDVERTLASIREDTARMLDVERPAAEGDVVTVDHVRVDDKGRTLKSSRVRDAVLSLGEPGLLPEFRQALVGSQPGESRTVHVQYPEDFSNAELAGRRAQFHVKVKKVQEKKLRDLDDNLAKEVFGLESLDELRSRIRLQLEGEDRLRARRELEEALVEELLRRNPVPVPEGLAARLTEDALRRSGMQLEQIPEAERGEIERGYRGAVERRIAREWLLDAVAQQEKIEVGEDELGQEMAKLARAQGRVGSEYRSLSQDRRRERVHDALMERKVFDFLFEASRIEEEKITEERPAEPAETS